MALLTAKEYKKEVFNPQNYIHHCKQNQGGGCSVQFPQTKAIYDHSCPLPSDIWEQRQYGGGAHEVSTSQPQIAKNNDLLPAAPGWRCCFSTKSN